MKSLTISTYHRVGDDGRTENVLSVFVHPTAINDDILDDQISPLLSQQGPFEHCNFHGTPESIQHIREALQSRSATALRLNSIGARINLLKWSTQPGIDFDVEDLDGNAVTNPILVAQEQRFSLFNAFESGGGLMTASRGTHFTKPSRSHSQQFLRAANVLERSSAVHQLAFWLYPLLKGKAVRRLVVDTTGITSIAFTLAYERLRRGDADTLPALESHASYGGLEKIDVTDREGTFFLISASTSGNLANELIHRGAKPENIFTLFYLGASTPGAVLCDLNADARLKFNGIPRISSHLESDCPDCKTHSYAIPIVGDQFRTEPAKIEEITVNLADFDESTRANLDKVISTGLFKVFKKVENRDFELYLDVENMLLAQTGDQDAKNRAKEFASRFDRLIQRGLPVHLKRIVPTTYPGTMALAQRALAFVPTPLCNAIQIVTSQSLLSGSPPDNGATLVISACLDETSELTGISRDLRTVQPGGGITYVSPVFRYSSEFERRQRESNLTFGDQGPKTFAQLSVIGLELPNCETAHSWQKEYDSLTKLKYWLDVEGGSVPQSILDRIELLRLAPAIGLVDDLFWPNPSGGKLILAPDFTMIPTRDGARPVPQADVYAIVATLFHKYRQTPGKNRPRLISRTYERTVISPATFRRFSDGILQASFLRAAREGELAYGNCDDAVSTAMLDFLLAEVRAASHQGGHALMEYLVALLIGRLTLHKAHAIQFCDSVINTSLAEHHRVVASYMKEILEGKINW